MQNYPQTRQRARVVTVTGDQQAFVRGVVNGVILSAGLWAAAIYVATILR